MNDNLAVHGGLEDGAFFLQLGAKGVSVDQVAVVTQGVVFAGVVDEEGLSVRQDRGAGGGVTDVTDGHVAPEAREALFGEDLRGKPHPLVLIDPASVGGGDTRALLSAVLEGEEAEEGEPRGLLVAVNGDNPARLTGPIPIG